ncbi:hypothetical protein BABA_22648 [Neobacillus bataviensis LMG 21833]|uniref:Uncharacterized protein n=1 Tax=Neobacillus bataviensis LMG 21833 TaxID=1117379 RepID=K6DV85_9BACI|nr:hypothetical protein [Neobacillus bataviensis]EKN64736.1 hypothetical protein BABA_22648 [Neobacillus bataviensis LMG 21833]
MSLVIFSTVSLIAVIYFAVKPKSLTPLELVMIVILVIYLDSNVMDIVMLNLKRIHLSENLAGQFAFYCTFILLYPLMIAWNIDHISSIRHKLGKFIFVLLTILTITGFESLSKYVKVVTYVNWNWWLDLAQWLTIWLATYFIHKLFQKLVLKELKQ